MTADRSPGVTPRTVPRVVVTGSESTGKTTLAAAIAHSLGTLWVPEYSRQYAGQVQRPLTAHDVEPIARGQIAAEHDGEARWRDRFRDVESPPPLVLDTDLVSTTVYARHYYGGCPPWIDAEAIARRGDLYLLCEPDLAWENDGIRDQPQARAALHDRFAGALRAIGARVAVVRGYEGARLGAALHAIRAWQGASPPACKDAPPLS